MEWPRFVHVFVDKEQKVVDFAFPNEKLLFSLGKQRHAAAPSIYL